jgi:predicted nucleic acid-binding protein
LTASVADAGPLIHLAEIGCLPFLRIFDIVHVPDAVWYESVAPRRVGEGDLNGLGNVRRHTLPREEVKRVTQELGLQTLQAGELESVTLCRQIGVPLLLTDDLAVREAAKRCGLRPVGSLGIVVRAYRLGRTSRSDAEASILALYHVSSLFVTRALADLAIAELDAGELGRE